MTNSNDLIVEVKEYKFGDYRDWFYDLEYKKCIYKKGTLKINSKSIKIETPIDIIKLTISIFSPSEKIEVSGITYEGYRVYYTMSYDYDMKNNKYFPLIPYKLEIIFTKFKPLSGR